LSVVGGSTTGNAYWKDPETKKLKKKYVGDHMPKDKELKYCLNSNKYCSCICPA
jgi:cupin superfamily acireductone dioxygenase involved in methionine salvage